MRVVSHYARYGSAGDGADCGGGDCRLMRQAATKAVFALSVMGMISTLYVGWSDPSIANALGSEFPVNWLFVPGVESPTPCLENAWWKPATDNTVCFF